MIKLASKFCKVYYYAQMRPKTKKSSSMAVNDTDGMRLWLGGPLHVLISSHTEKLRRTIEIPNPPGVGTVGTIMRAEDAPVLKRIIELERYIRRSYGRHRGHPHENKISVLNACDEWLLDPGTSWRLMAAKHGFPNRKRLERSVLRLKAILKKEGIPFPHRAQNIPPHN